MKKEIDSAVRTMTMCPTILAGLRNIGLPTKDWDPVTICIGMRRSTTEPFLSLRKTWKIQRFSVRRRTVLKNTERCYQVPSFHEHQTTVNPVPKNKIFLTLEKRRCSYRKEILDTPLKNLLSKKDVSL